MPIRNMLVCAIAAATAIVAADLPYAGKWKMNPAKSDFAGMTVAYQSLPSGEWQSTLEGHSYKFKMDGKDYPDGLGGMVAWTPIDANTWQSTSKVNGNVVTTDTVKVSGDGRSLAVNSKGTKPNGSAIDETVTFQRLSGGPGLQGKWKTTTVKTTSPAVVELVPAGSDGLTFREPEWNLTCDTKLDGKDYPCTGPTLPPGWTVAMTKAGSRSLDLLIKKDGKPFYKESYTVAPDGKSMTAVGGAVATNERVKVVFDRE